MSPPTQESIISRESPDFKAGYEEGYERAKSWVCDKCYTDLP